MNFFIYCYFLFFLIQNVYLECHVGSVNFVRTSNVRPLDIILEQIKHKLQISSLRCHQQCIDNSSCVSYLYDSNALNCYLITNDNLKINHQNLFRAPGWSYHRRICLTSDLICNQQWAFESYGSTQFDLIADKIITKLNSEETCLNACSNEKQFICRSAVYNHQNRTCSLHSTNRNNSSDILDDQQVFSSNLLYMENLCVQQGCEIWRTHFELIEGLQALGVIYFKKTDNLQPSECIEICKKDVNCKSINIDYKEGSCEFFDELNTIKLDTPIDLNNNSTEKIFDQQIIQQSNQQSIQQEFLRKNQLQKNIVNNYQTFLQQTHQLDQTQNNLPQTFQAQTIQNKFIKEILEQKISGGIDNLSQINNNSEITQQSLNNQTENQKFKNNINVNYFVKTCLTELNSCGTDWTFERIVDKRLEIIDTLKLEDDQYYLEKIIPNITSREQCQSACLKHSIDIRYGQAKYQNSKLKNANFICRSLNYNTKTGFCKLMSFNRHSSFGRLIKLENNKPDFEYIENNCLQEPKGFCNWKSSYKKKLVFADKIIVDTNLTSCKEKCLNQNAFNCRSISFDLETSLCFLSHHSAFSLPEEAILDSTSLAVFSELSTCFKIEVDCQATDMLVNVNVNVPFKGRVYAKSNPKNCSLDVKNSLSFNFPISLNESICGTTFQHGSEFSNILVIQGNDQVLTSLDKAIGVKCSYDLDSITGEAVLFVNELSLTDTGRSSASLPDLSLHVMDINGLDRQEVNLGELLKVQVQLSDEKTYGIFVRNLIAKDEFGLNNLTLIDKYGCPAQAKMMREVRKTDSTSKQLESYFEAFSFTGCSELQLEAEVETCLNSCRPAQCQVVSGRSNDDYETVVSYGRKKREYNILDLKILSQSVKIVVPDFIPNNQNQKVKNDDINQTLTEKILFKQNKLNKKENLYSINETGHFCFEPTILTILSCFTFLIQAIFLSVILIVFYKNKFEEKKYIF